MAEPEHYHEPQSSGDQSNSASNDEAPLQELTGWLMKRTRLARKWEKKWFAVRRCEIVYGSNEGMVQKHIQLLGAQVAESAPDKKSHAFKIRPKDSKRVYYMQAESEEKQREWMQAIFLAKAIGGRTDQSEACTIQ